MKCPILLAPLSPAERTPVGAGECLKEECELWLRDRLACPFRIIASALGKLIETMERK